MKQVLIAVILLGLFSASLAAVSQGVYADKNHPGKCNVDGRILDPGTHQSPDKCVRIECGSSGVAAFATCGVKKYMDCEPGSLVDETKDYPDCCKQNFNCSGTIEQI